MTRQAISSTRTTLTTIDRLGGSIKAATRKAIEEELGAQESVRQLHRGLEAPSFAAAVLDAHRAGRNVLTDPDVRAALIAQQIDLAHSAIEYVASDRLQRLLATHTAEMYGALADLYRTHVAEPVAEAAATLDKHGVTPTSDPAVVLNAGPAAAAAWSQMQQALAHHATLVNTTQLLDGATGIHRAGDAVFVWAAPGSETGLGWIRQQRGLTPWAAHRAGMTLALTSPEESAERQFAASRTDSEQRTADEQAWQAASVRRLKVTL